MDKVNFKTRIYTSVFLMLSFLSGFSQEDVSAQSKTIAVYGDGFAYSIETPDGWMADTSASNGSFANIILSEKKADPFFEKTVILVYVFRKEDETLKEDLNSDISNFREEHKKNETEEDFLVNRSGFKCYNKLLFVTDSLYQYLVYIDPGKKSKSGVSVSMNSGQKRATDKQMEALRKVVNSVKLLEEYNITDFEKTPPIGISKN
jgi:hypothetical protein